MQLPIEIPVKSHVSKFLAEKFPGGFRLNKRTHLGIALFSMLRRENVDSQFDAGVAEYPCVFKVNVGEHSFFERGCRKVSSETVFQFNTLVQDLMEAEMFGVIEFLEMYGVEQKQAI